MRRKKQIYPMTSEQSLIAASIFLSFFVIWFLWAAVGQSTLLWIEAHPGTAAWAQAFSSFIAILFAGKFVGRQLRHTEFQQYRLQLEMDAKSVWACLYAARDARSALHDLSKKLSGESRRPPSSSTERIEGLEETIRVLLASQPCAAAVSSLLVVMTELAYSRVAIREYTAGTDRAEQARKAKIRTKKVDDAARNLGQLYTLLDNSIQELKL